MSVVLQIVLALVAIGFLITWHELGHFLAARLCGMRVLKFSIGFGPAFLKKTVGETDYQVSVIPLGGYVQISGMTDLEDGAAADPKSFINQSYLSKLMVVLAGPVFNFAMAFVLLFGLFWLSSVGKAPSFEVNQLSPDSAAEKAGMKVGDVITHIDGNVFVTTADFLAHIAKSNGHSMAFAVDRGAEHLVLNLAPIQDAQGIWRAGIGYIPLSFTFTGALAESGKQIVMQCVGTLRALFLMITGGGGGGQVGGVIEITRQLSQAAKQGLKNYIWIVASLSTVLGLFNLLPIPALDGSRALLVTVEKVIRRPLPARLQIGIQIVGLVLVLGLMILLTVWDILRLI